MSLAILLDLFISSECLVSVATAAEEIAVERERDLITMTTMTLVGGTAEGGALCHLEGGVQEGGAH